MTWLLIGLGGFLGALFRYSFYYLLTPFSSSYSYATILVNLLGSFLFGFLLGINLDSNNYTIYLFLTGGFLGAFTTFSTFTYELATYLNQKKYAKFLLHISLHLFVGIGVAILGFNLVR